MKVKALIACLEALGAPDAEVFFLARDSLTPINVEGGLLDIEEQSGREGVLLAQTSFQHAGGF